MSRPERERSLVDGVRGVLARSDRVVIGWMGRWGPGIERIALAILFLWFGTLKVVGQQSATTIIAKTVYVQNPEPMVIVLGVWEALIGVCFLFKRVNRIAIALLLIRLPGTALALLLKYDVCFEENIFTPSIQGQYLLKDLALFGAALVIGSGVGSDRRDDDPERA